ncbi:MAG TPA: hypothetical protein VMS76_04475 [Planctomycetota bacterium]|nr:hypothetical protein [Planctomycetota bacterium]
MRKAVILVGALALLTLCGCDRAESDAGETNEYAGQNVDAAWNRIESVANLSGERLPNSYELVASFYFTLKAPESPIEWSSRTIPESGSWAEANIDDLHEYWKYALHALKEWATKGEELMFAPQGLWPDAWKMFELLQAALAVSSTDRDYAWAVLKLAWVLRNYGDLEYVSCGFTASEYAIGYAEQRQWQADEQFIRWRPVDEENARALARHCVMSVATLREVTPRNTSDEQVLRLKIFFATVIGNCLLHELDTRVLSNCLTAQEVAGIPLVSEWPDFALTGARILTYGSSVHEMALDVAHYDAFLDRSK